MYKHHNFVVPTMQNKVERWNTKPPFFIWLEVGFMRLIGVNEMAVRLPSVLSGLLLFLALIFLLKKLGFSRITSIACSVLLLSAKGYNGQHGLRFGEFDAMLTFWIVAFQVFCFAVYLTNDTAEIRKKYLWLTVLGFIGAVYTKAITGLFLAPVVLVFGFASGRFQKEKLRSLVLMSVVAIAGCLSFYLIREMYDPGYIKSVMANDVMERFSAPVEQHQENRWYYFNEMYHQTGVWLFLIPVVWIMAFLHKNFSKRRILAYVISCAGFYFLILQLADTKNFWYLMPVVVLLGISFLLALEMSIDFIREKWFSEQDQRGFSMIHLAILSAVLIQPFVVTCRVTLHQNQNVDGDHGFYRVTNYIRNEWRTGQKGLKWKFIDTEYSAHNWWYISLLNDHGNSIQYFIDLDSIGAGDQVLIRQPELRDSLEKMYTCDYLHDDYACWLMKLEEKK